MAGGGNQHGSPFVAGADQFEQHAGFGLILGGMGETSGALSSFRKGVLEEMLVQRLAYGLFLSFVRHLPDIPSILPVDGSPSSHLLFAF